MLSGFRVVLGCKECPGPQTAWDDRRGGQPQRTIGVDYIGESARGEHSEHRLNEPLAETTWVATALADTLRTRLKYFRVLSTHIMQKYFTV